MSIRRLARVFGATVATVSRSSVSVEAPSPSQPGDAAAVVGAVDAVREAGGAATGASGAVASGGAAVVATALQPLDDRQQFDKVAAAASSAAHRNIIMPRT